MNTNESAPELTEFQKLVGKLLETGNQPPAWDCPKELHINFIPSVSNVAQPVMYPNLLKDSAISSYAADQRVYEADVTFNPSLFKTIIPPMWDTYINRREVDRQLREKDEEIARIKAAAKVFVDGLKEEVPDFEDLTTEEAEALTTLGIPSW